MLSCALWAIFAQLSQVERPLHGVEIGNVTPFTGQPTTNYLHADVDQDGDADLLLPGRLLLQYDLAYDENESVLLPAPPGATEADVFAGQIYFRGPGRLWAYVHEQNGWKKTIDQPIAWPGEDDSFSQFRGVDRQVAFKRFLHDFDGDGTPELVAVDAHGARFYRLREGGYSPAGRAELPSIITDSRTSPQPVWPQSERKLLFPEQQMSCRLLFEGDTALTVSVYERREDTNVFRIQRADIRPTDEGPFVVDNIQVSIPEPLPAHLRPCRLNNDATLDFAGGRWIPSEGGPVPTPIYELWASLDNGATFQIRRAAGYARFRPHAAFVDFDGDGDMDMVTESTRWPHGSIREQVAQFLTKSSLTHHIAIYEQDAGQFSTQPMLEQEVTITLEDPPVKKGPVLTRYVAGELVNITGDLNGDGYRDLVVRSRRDQVEVFLAKGWSHFERVSEWDTAVSPDSDVHVADLNLDGLSDLYLTWRSGEAKMKGEGVARYTRGDSP